MLFYNEGGIMVKKGLYLSLIAVLLIGIAGFAGCRRHSPENKAEFMVDYVAVALCAARVGQIYLPLGILKAPLGQ